MHVVHSPKKARFALPLKYAQLLDTRLEDQSGQQANVDESFPNSKIRDGTLFRLHKK